MPDHNDACDHFTSLPSEILQHIASHLYATHFPDQAYHDNERNIIRRRAPLPDLINLASTSKTLRQQTNAWALHFLRQHQAVLFKSPKKQKLAAPLRHLLLWSSKKCVFCGKPTPRTAILMNGLKCCRACDREQWPDKITKTDAMKTYHLKEHQLLPSRHHAKKLLTLHPGLPALRYGTYFATGVLTTMFLKTDVEAFAELAHGDLRGHLRKREVARVERERVLREGAKRAEERAERSHRQVALQEVIVIDDDEEL